MSLFLKIKKKAHHFMIHPTLNSLWKKEGNQNNNLGNLLQLFSYGKHIWYSDNDATVRDVNETKKTARK
jgi:hypothetical protein